MSLVGHWRLDGDLTDSAGNNDGSGSPSFVSGKLGQAIDGDGSTITVSRSDSIDAAFSGDEMTLSLWWQQTDQSGNSGFRDIVRMDGDRLERGNADQTTTADYWCNLGSGNDANLYNPNTDVPSGEWFHMLIRRNGEDFEAWVNGELDDSLTTADDITLSGDLRFNISESGSNVDDIRLYDHAVSVKKIKRLSQAKALHYKFNNSITEDISGQDNYGINNGASLDNDRKIGTNSGQFNGTGDYIGTNLSYNTTELRKVSVSAWYKSSSTSDQIIASSDRNEYWRLGVGSASEDGVQWTVYSSDIVSSVSRTSLQDGNWHHIVGVFDATLTNDHKIYIDGELDTEVNVFSSGIGSNAISFTHIGVGSEASVINGGRGPNDWMDGNLDDVRVYHSALSQAEIKRIYEQRASIDSKGELYSHELSEEVTEGLSLSAESAGNDSPTGGFSELRVNGTKLGATGRGINILEINRSGDEIKTESFDVFGQSTVETNNLVDFIQSADTGNILLFAVDDHPGRIEDSGVEIIQELGSQYITDVQGGGRNSWAFITTKGLGWHAEKQAPSGEGPVLAEHVLPDDVNITETGITEIDVSEVGPAGESLVGWWPLENGADNLANNYDSYEVNSPDYSSGRIKSAYDNTANNNTGIELVRHADFVPYENEYTFSLWFKSTSTTGDSSARIISRDASEYPSVIIDQSQSSPQPLYNSGIADTSVTTNQWHHLVFTIDQDLNDSKIFIDGELRNTSSTFSSTTERPYVIGGNTEGDGDVSGNHFVGKIDDVRLYDRTLTDEEVALLYNSTDPEQKQNVIQSDNGEVYTKQNFDETL